jgi:hypothetical protein
MRRVAMALIGVLGIIALPLSARAVPIAPDLSSAPTRIVQAWVGCGWGWHPVAGHWSYRRGGWVPPHCEPNRPYGGWGPYWGWRRYGG